MKAGDQVTADGVFATDGHQNAVFWAEECADKRLGLLLDQGDGTVSEFDAAVLAEAVESGGADRHYRLTLRGRYLPGHGKPDGVIEVSHIARWERVGIAHPHMK